MIASKNLKAGLVCLFIAVVFSFTALIEYQSVYDENYRQGEDELLIIQTKLENMLESRINSASNIRIFIENKESFSQVDYEDFVQDIHASSYNVIRNLTLITDTTISHVYPYSANYLSIGRDLAQVEDQKELILYAKDTGQVVVTAPVNLVEGGQGIIVRIPLEVDHAYYGQIAIVFDYEQVLKQTGIHQLSKAYKLKLTTYDPIQEQTSVIWSNTDQVDHPASHAFSIYDFTISLEGQPKKGWRGTSVMFYAVIILGLVVSGGSYFIVLKYLNEKDKLHESHDILESTNLQLEAANNQLLASEQDLTVRYEEMEAQKTQIEYLAKRDSLTGLYNRRKCIEDIENKLYEKKNFSLVLFDLDNFKNINDTRGHGYGDKILRKIALWLNETLPDHTESYRIGGDEFVILIPRMVEEKETESFLHHMFESFHTFKAYENINEPITISAGITYAPDQGDEVSTLMMKADLAMYASKNTGKDKFAFFDDEMYQTLNRKLHIETLLREAVDKEDFSLLYQPILGRDQTVASYEALIRMNQTTMSPGIFIPIAEEMGLVGTIGRWVIKQVLKQLLDWQAKGMTLKPVAINISPSQIYEGNIDQFLEKEIRASGLSPGLIEIEVTENIFLSNNMANVRILENIKALGCTISLDDFGSGFSSLSYLTYMPVDKIKLDKSLKDKFLPIEDIKLEGLITFCHSLNLLVVTEGVETMDEATKLLDQGTDYLQGYAFSRPVTPAEVLYAEGKTYTIS